MEYAQLNTTTNYTFLTGASHPHEYIEQAIALGYRALAITDEASLAGTVKAYKATQGIPTTLFKLLIGSRFRLSNNLQIIAIAPNRAAYAELSGFITLTRRRSTKGHYQAHMEDLRFRLRQCLIIWLADPALDTQAESIITTGKFLVKAFRQRLWIGINLQMAAGEQHTYLNWIELAQHLGVPVTACGEALMHKANRKPLQDTITAIKTNTPVSALGSALHANAEAYLKPLQNLQTLYPAALIEQACTIADRCHFSLQELQYQYPTELVPSEYSPAQYLQKLVNTGKKRRYPNGVPADVENIIQTELALIHKCGYEYFFLTVHDIVCFAQKQGILYQGRGSAANSVVCYCLHITEISPQQINVLFERFISEERNEPPDIDVDFEHRRREEVIQYIYQKYGRERAALAASVTTYRSKSAMRDVGKALGLNSGLIDHLTKSLAWWDKTSELQDRIESAGLKTSEKILTQYFQLVHQILGFPRHLSQHVGGFVITKDKVSDLVPLENASMPDRTIIQWDKNDLETMGLLKVDILALGMLTALRKALDYVHQYEPTIQHLHDIPREDPATYNMLCAGDSIGVFQVESRAQMSMLPRLKPKTFYDLVIQIAIVRPGPIQGDMVHPYLRRRDGLDKTTYINDKIKRVLEPTLGIPIFQEQAIRLSMVAAGFTGGEADNLRRAMASWGKTGDFSKLEQKFLQGMKDNGYPDDYAHKTFEHIKGFSGYGFPESHSASFAILCYISSWLKCHHPAAFYCALLNSQPMGFYSPSQLVQDAQRHGIKIQPVDINKSHYENQLEKIDANESATNHWGIRLGFSRVRQLSSEKAKNIAHVRNTPFKNIADLSYRAALSPSDLQHLAASDALRPLLGNRHTAHWQTSAAQSFNAFLHAGENQQEQPLLTPAPNINDDIVGDYQTLGLTLRAHPMRILRDSPPFNQCTRQTDLSKLSHGKFVRVAGLVTGRQRPGTAKGTLFLTLEDETGNINVVIWKSVQETCRQALLTSKLLLVKGSVEFSHQPHNAAHSVIHVVAGQLIDYTSSLTDGFNLSSRDFH